jgi:hypothetical protein
MEIFERSACGFFDQTGKAFRAATTARSTSAFPPSGTRAISIPVAGLKTGYVRPDSALTHFPPIQILYSDMLLTSLDFINQFDICYINSQLIDFSSLYF